MKYKYCVWLLSRLPRKLKLVFVICIMLTMIYFLVTYNLKNRILEITYEEQTVKRPSPVTLEAKKITNRNSKPFWNANSGLSNDEVIRFGRCRGHVVLAVVVCGDRRRQSLVTLKSAVALSTTTIHLVIMADSDNQVQIAEEMLDWPSSVLLRMSFEVHPITFPQNKMADEWRKLFKPCAAQRLFLPSVLSHIDSLLYVDTDVLFLRSPDDIWSFFFRMNSSQMAALSPEHEDFATGWYNRFARHPFYQPLGVNSGVMLMNLTRLRSFQWDSYLEPIFQQYKPQIVWGDQDIINIIFHYHSDKLLIFGCEWNYRPDHCMYSSVCKSADVKGISILHGNRGTFSNGKQPPFQAVYQAFDGYLLGSNLRKHLLLPLKQSLKATFKTNCGKNYHMYYRQLEQSIARLYKHRFPTCSKSREWTI